MSVAVRSVCRDCEAASPELLTRCPGCGSRRLVAHDDLAKLTIAHLDCDAFYASVEKRDRPELRDVPIIVGGGTRGVVTTACYIARVSGVRSAMPMFQARKLCPRAIIVRPDMEKYGREGRRIREMMRDLTPDVEPLSIDEAFMDLSGTEALHHAPPALTLVRLANAVRREVGITVSIGLAPNKFLAKVASDMRKPDAFSVIGPAEGAEILGPMPVSVMWGAGPVLQGRLRRDGIERVEQLQAMSEADLVGRYGSMGLRLARLSHGRDPRAVKSARKDKSVSNETTFRTDISDLDTLLPILRRICEKVSNRLKEKEIAGGTIVLKLKTADFRLRTRNRTLATPTQLADRMYREAADLLQREADGTRFRLLGVGVSDLCDAALADPDDMIDTSRRKRAAAERAMDKVRAKFGGEAVGLGLTFANPMEKKNRPDVIWPNADDFRD